jgi:endo-1,4-beta-xylanase
MWLSRPADAPRSSRRRVIAAGTVTATLAGMATLAIGSTAHAALAPGTPLKTLAAANGSRYFGSDMTGDLLSNSNVTQLQTQQFNMLTPGNEMKWDTTQPSQTTFNFAPGDAIVNYATSNSERVRCHNLVWHSQLPSWVSSLPSNQVQAAMENHITTEATHFKGKCYAWDVVNEPFNEDGTFRADAFSNAMGGMQYIADALKTARAADPAAKLYLNDFNIEGQNAKSNAMFSLAQSLLAAGVPLDGIGFESHFIEGQNPSGMQANMQRFANLGLDVAVTELDDRFTSLPPSSAGLQQQATDFANTVKACLGVTRCVGVTQWAIGDPDSWVPGAFSGQGAATMFDSNYAPKPAFTAVQNALGGTANTVTVTNPGAQTGTVGTAFSKQLSATDSAAGQTLTWSATGLPAGLTISAGGLISGTPTANSTSSVTVTAKDSTGASGSATFTFTVTGGTGNTITVTNPGARTGTVGTAVSLQLSATDSGAGQTLTWSATGLPAGLAISAGGLISGTPTTAATSSVTVTARDGTGATGSATFTFTISNGQSGGGACHVTYTRNSEWPGGFTAQVVIQNTSSTALSSWSVTFTWGGDQKITSNFNGGFSQTGANATLTNASYNGTIAPNGSVTDGFQGTWTSNDAAPTGFAVNGTACS